MSRLKRLAVRCGRDGNRLRADSPRWMMREFVFDIGASDGEIMFKRMEKGQVVAVRAIDFTYVGKLVEWDDSSVTLADAVMILWDGRHGEFSAGKPPTSAEIEKTYPIFTLAADAIVGWGPYPGNKIPGPQ